jgi:hypothetical protein
MIAALTGIPEAIKRMEKHPDTRLPQVMALGMCFLSSICLRFRNAKIVFFELYPNNIAEKA